ncbi:TetR family transcriptional regulator C-terminal domain-containing protein [Paenibacillus sp. IB182496]|uniref:TetR family transcriptional regulator C-terminal domain-containing protein n=1 Tax=Paenibacillus sabuli TaxID=2772509 RepID=A0A927GS40_9BACL|nr:TetR/AcrR family transcriptional regulator [Paenibacillus sabuli]MBD2845640.1 TetR family transcriptional regulator C-terminal domain-containing protein [Paenibacillus sabuli]
MPKIVNHDERKEQLAEAAWRVIRRDGLEGASVRSIADEAGMSLGSLRHYFMTQAELLQFSMRLVSERVRARIEHKVYSGDPYRDIAAIIGELVPLDEERLAECEVWLAFVGSSVADPALRELGQEVHNELYRGFRQIVDSLIRLGLARPGIDASLETMRLHALVDGLVVHGVTRQGTMTREHIQQIIAYHMDELSGN